MAPAHGMDDYKLCKKHSMEIKVLVDENGNFTKNSGEELSGKFILKEGTTFLIEKFSKLGCLIKVNFFKYILWKCIKNKIT